MKPLIKVALSVLFLMGFVGLGLTSITKNQQHLDVQKIQLLNTTTKLKTLELKYNQLNLELDKASKDKNSSQDQIKQLEQQRDQLEQQKTDLEKQVSLKKAAQVAEASRLQQAASLSTPVYAASCSDAKSCIYYHESGNNPSAVNSIGCYGLGQDCNGIVRNRCGANYACQDEYFSSYAVSRYGSWASAWSFWQVHSWW